MNIELKEIAKLFLLLLIVFGNIAVFSACILSGRISRQEEHDELIKKGQK